MSDFKGTKGPWLASKSDRSIGPVIKDDDQSYGMILPVAWVEFNGKPGHQEADANLIAAAPELLEALQAMVSRIKYYANLDSSQKPSIEDWAYTYNSSDMDAAREAIAKALGSKS